MLRSVSGQNDYWALAAAHQSPVPQPSQNGASGSTSATTAPSALAANPPLTGGTTAPLSDPMSSMIMALLGGWGSSGWGSSGLGNGVATASQNARQSAGAGNASPSTATAPASGGISQPEEAQVAAIQAGTAQAGTAQAGTAAAPTVPASLPTPASQLATDLQSLLTTLRGPYGASAASTGTTGSAVASGATAESGAAAASPVVSTSLLQDLQKVASDLNTIGRASGPRRPGQDAAPQSTPPPWSNDILNTGTATENGPGGTGGWNPGYRDAFQQQFATAAYSTSAQSTADAPLTGINV